MNSNNINILQRRKLSIQLVLSITEAALLGLPLFIWGGSIDRLAFLILWIFLYSLVAMVIFLFPLISTPSRVDIGSQQWTFHYVLRKSQVRQTTQLALSLEERTTDGITSTLIHYEIPNPFPAITEKKLLLISKKFIDDRVVPLLSKGELRINTLNTGLKGQELESALVKISHWVRAANHSE